MDGRGNLVSSGLFPIWSDVLIHFTSYSILSSWHSHWQNWIKTWWLWWMRGTFAEKTKNGCTFSAEWNSSISSFGRYREMWMSYLDGSLLHSQLKWHWYSLARLFGHLSLQQMRIFIILWSFVNMFIFYCTISYVVYQISCGLFSNCSSCTLGSW